MKFDIIYIMKKKKDFEHKNWKIDLDDNLNVKNVLYENKPIVSDVNFFTINNNISKKMTALLKANKLPRMVKFINKEKVFSDYSMHWKRKFIYEVVSRAQLEKYAINIRKKYLITDNGINITVMFSIGDHYYSPFRTSFYLNSIDGIKSIKKVKKESITTDLIEAKNWNQSYKDSLEIKIGKNSFSVFTSLGNISRDDNVLSMGPIESGKQKEIMKSWKIRRYTNYQMSFSITKIDEVE